LNVEIYIIFSYRSIVTSLQKAAFRCSRAMVNTEIYTKHWKVSSNESTE